ncbi:MAG TPA: GNAT family N-acetyltransferase, partial [Dehalococcoidales bacterium]|nr:GNAT family N-acetyltransferase [Dehalococcoidales bacterium]
MPSSTYKTLTLTDDKNKKYADACLTVAKERSEYFEGEGIPNMAKDLQKHALYVAVNSAEVMGFATIDKKSEFVAEISWMAVKPKHERQGIGSALVDHITNDLKPQGFRVLEVKTLASYDKDKAAFERTYAKTKRFYEKTGFM